MVDGPVTMVHLGTSTPLRGKLISPLAQVELLEAQRDSLPRGRGLRPGSSKIQAGALSGRCDGISAAAPT